MQLTPTTTLSTGIPATLTDFLSRHPWPTRWTEYGQPVDEWWTFDLPVSVLDIWPYLTDTSGFNQRLGLARMDFTEKDGKLFGRSKNAGFEMAWEEVPWEWEYGRHIFAARIYQKGFAHYVRVHFYLQSIDASTTRVMVYFGWIPRGWSGRAILKIGMKNLRKSYHTVFQQIVSEIQSGQKSSQSTHYLSESGQVKVRDIRRKLVERNLAVEWVDRVLDYVATQPPLDLDRIRVRQLAQIWQIDENQLLTLFLHATRVGLFYLTWDVICPHCRGVRQEIQHLWDVPQVGSCDVCDTDFETSGLNALEVTFHIHPEIRPVEKVFYCSAEPSRKFHIKFQKTVAAGQAYQTPLMVPAGRYRLRIQGQKSYNYLEIDPGLTFTRVEWNPDDVNRHFQSGAEPTLLLHNPDESPQTFIVEEHEIDRLALRPVDLFNFQDFRDLFADEALAYDMQLDVGVQNILFIDVVGSTDLYQKLGDNKAFLYVRQHFRIVHDLIREHNGAIVKTIGDAVMIAFTTTLDALKAGVDIQKHFDGDTTESPLRVRISLNRGPCLAVRLNSNIDYFGQTVNVAAKIQAYADAGQIAFTKAVHDEPLVTAFLANHTKALETIEGASIKGFGTTTIWRLTIH